MMNKKNNLISAGGILLLASFFLWGCGKKMPVVKYIGGESFSLINQDSSKVTFPDNFRGNIVAIGFIYTNCPDICPLTTHNLQLIQQKAKKDGLKNVQILALSFDPQRDIPSKLKEFGDIRNVDYSNFQFLTGKKTAIDSILKEMNVIAIPGDTTIVDGKKVYFFTHTDRITLIDQKGYIRNEYKGSTANVAKVIDDIKKLGG